MSQRLTELRERTKEKQTLAMEVLKLAGDTRDFSRKDVLEKLGATDSADAVVKWNAVNAEASGLIQQARELAQKEEFDACEQRDEELKRGRRDPVHPSGETQDLSIGAMVVKSKAFEEYLKTKVPTNIDLPDARMSDLIGLKTLMSTTAGFAPDSPRTADVVPFARRPIQILSLIPVRPIGVPIAKWMEKTTETISAAEIAEAATYPESVYVYTERTAPIQKVADSLPVTDEQLEDVDGMLGLIQDDIGGGVRLKIDSQVVVGTGTPPQIRGITNYAGIQTQARGTDPHFDAIFKAITKVRATGRAEPDAVAIHSTDWQTFRLMRTADGIYIMGNPAEVGSVNLFGLPIAINEVLTVGTALVGAYREYSYLAEKRGVLVEVGFTGTQFTEGKKTVRASARIAMVVRRAAAYCTVTGL
jgi:HK97 family phage major capsid protein